MIDIRPYYDEEGKSAFVRWHHRLNHNAALKVNRAITRMEQGNFSNVRAVGRGVSEYRINFGPGYRIYFGMDGAELVILLGGGAKQGQQQDIQTAQRLWEDYKRSKQQEG